MGREKGALTCSFSRVKSSVFSQPWCVAFPRRGCYVFSLDEEECYGSEITV